MLSEKLTLLLQVGFTELYTTQQKECILTGLQSLPNETSLSTFSFILTSLIALYESLESK